MKKVDAKLCLITFAAAIGIFVSCTTAKPEKTAVKPVEGLVISASDKPVGVGNPVQQEGEGVVVSTRDEFITALSNGGLIYVNGMIDLSDGYMPSVAGGSSEKLDALVKEVSTRYFESQEKISGNLITDRVFENYDEFKTAYAANCAKDTNDKKKGTCTSKYGELLWKLNDSYKAIIRPMMVSNTTIIGMTEESGLAGGTLIVNTTGSKPAVNVVIRNLVIRDAYDPFPHHEANDGFNAQFDTMCIQDGSHDVWIDHCTFYDTLGMSYVTISDGSEEKWQTYDGLLDMKSEGTTGITVSWCRFMNHDKTMLIGSSDTELSGGNREVTLHHNLFLNCGQRLPMVRQTNLHAFNNVYIVDEPYYKSQYAIGVRNQAKILSENNYFGGGVLYSFSGINDTKKQGSVFSFGDADNSVEGMKPNNFTVLKADPFFAEYDYILDSTDVVVDIVTKNAGTQNVTLM